MDEPQSQPDAQQERLRAFDQQYEIQIAMILAGTIPAGGNSPDFIVRTLERQNYNPARLADMKALLPLLKQEIEYLEMRDEFQRLSEGRAVRVQKMNDFIRQSLPQDG